MREELTTAYQNGGMSEAEFDDALDAIYEQELKEGIHPGDEFRASISYTTDNRPVVVVNDDILRGVRNTKEAISRVNESLKRFKRVPISGQTIYLLSDTRNEYINSNYSKYLKKKDKTIYESKMRLAAHPQDIIYATTDYINEQPNHPRKDNIIDFARGKILFDISGKQYEGEVIVGFTKAGICELHDIVGIKATSFEYKKESERARNFGDRTDSESVAKNNSTAIASDTIISNTLPAVNTTSENVTQMQQSESRASISRTTEDKSAVMDQLRSFLGFTSTILPPLRATSLCTREALISANV